MRKSPHNTQLPPIRSSFRKTRANIGAAKITAISAVMMVAIVTIKRTVGAKQ